MSREISYDKHAEGQDLQDRKFEIEQLLRSNICEVTFTKVDGSLRSMPCTMDSSRFNWSPKPRSMPAVTVLDTLDPTNISLDSLLEVKAPRRKPELNLSVWCMDKEGWRSFKVANVVHVRVLDGN